MFFSEFLRSLDVVLSILVHRAQRLLAPLDLSSILRSTIVNSASEADVSTFSEPSPTASVLFVPPTSRRNFARRRTEKAGWT